MRKNKQFSIRISSQDLETIRQKAAQAHMSQSDYVTACCLGKRIVILNGLKEVLRQQKAIGNNLNQLAVLANMGKVQFANLDAGTVDRGCAGRATRPSPERHVQLALRGTAAGGFPRGFHSTAPAYLVDIIGLRRSHQSGRASENRNADNCHPKGNGSAPCHSGSQVSAWESCRIRYRRS